MRVCTSIRALLVDGLGTLVDLEAPAPVLAGTLARRFGVAISPAQAGDALAAEIRFYRAHMADGRDAESLAGLRQRCAEVLRAALPSSPALDHIGPAAMADALLESLRFHAHADARPALLAARAAGVRVIVVSNWDVSLPEVLERVGLAPLVDATVTSAAVGAAKPAPEIFAHALALAGVGASGAVHVGDTLSEDVAGARACEIEPVLVRRGGEAPPGADPVTTIAALTEIAWPPARHR
jgi:putative hydrolase of the HAD superfamily